jgi:hypothetical protein
LTRFRESLKAFEAHSSIERPAIELR